MPMAARAAWYWTPPGAAIRGQDVSHGRRLRQDVCLGKAVGRIADRNVQVHGGNGYIREYKRRAAVSAMPGCSASMRAPPRSSRSIIAKAHDCRSA
jgi:alkylation response protein AidB-like acyl-CoA dehydrogenase